jgi:hypothetical protein
MTPTQFHRAALASRHSEPVSPALAIRRRLVAFAELFTDAARKPDALYGLQRKEPRCQLPDEKQRTMIHDAIKAGTISPARIIRYRLFQLQDDLAQYSKPVELADVCYTHVAKELGEAVEALAVARMQPTPGNIDAARRESAEASVASSAFCGALDFWRRTGLRS